MSNLDSLSNPDPGPWGKLYGIGAGPGDPELITVKGLRLLQRSPIVAFPSGRNGQPGIAEQIVKTWLQPSQRRLALDFPYIQDDAALQQAWDAAAAEILPYLQQGQDVCFVSEGDVSFYSTFSYLAHSVQPLTRQRPASNARTVPAQANVSATTDVAELIQTGPEIITIPGICSPLTAAAMAGHPLTLRQQKLVVLPALYDAAALSQAMDFADVVVLMKIGAEYQKIWSILKAKGRLENSYIVQRASWPQQRIYQDLGDRPALDLDYFSLWVIPVTQPPPPFGNLTV